MPIPWVPFLFSLIVERTLANSYHKSTKRSLLQIYLLVRDGDSFGVKDLILNLVLEQVEEFVVHQNWDEWLQRFRCARRGSSQRFLMMFRFFLGTKLSPSLMIFYKHPNIHVIVPFSHAIHNLRGFILQRCQAACYSADESVFFVFRTCRRR